jgi:tRNA(Ile)-lysidine synthase
VRARDVVRRELRKSAARLPDLLTPGARLVVGYSGGQDSTCLLHALATSRLKLDVVAAHVDHCLRAESATDAQRVAALATSIGVDVRVRRVDVAAYRRGLPGWSVQQAARAARYHALAEIAQELQARAVMTGHTADDQAETLLINLLRGTGLAGLAAMPLDETLDLTRVGPLLTDRSSNVHAQRLRLARPLLRVSRSITQAYCAESGLALVEDASNQSRAYTRNRVRIDLLPVLERFNPAIRAVLARTADLAAEDVAALDAVVAQLAASLERQTAGDDELEYDLGLWRAQPRALQRRLLRHGLERLLGALVDVRAAPIEDALDVVQSGQPAQTYHLPYGIELCLQAEAFVLRRHGRARPRSRPKTWGAKASRV